MHDKAVSEISGYDLTTFMADRLDSVKTSTVHKQLRAMNVFFTWCIKNHLTVENPIRAAA